MLRCNARALPLVLVGVMVLGGRVSAQSPLPKTPPLSGATINVTRLPPTTWAGIDASGTITKNVEQRWTTPTLASGIYLFTMSDSRGDADLYTRIGTPPTTATYDCRPAKSGLDETCELSLHAAAVLHIMVRGYADSSTFRLVGRKK